MSAGEVVHTASTGGQKAGNNVRASLLPWAEIMEVAELYGTGAKKYPAHNWTKGYDWSLSFDALQRHLSEFWLGREYDDGEGGTGLPHLSCVAFHVFALMYFSKHHRALDDRHIAPAQPVGTIDPAAIITSGTGAIIFREDYDLSATDVVPYHDNFAAWLDRAKWDAISTQDFSWVIKRDTLPADTIGLWRSETNSLVYWFLEGEWWVMRYDSQREDPWSRSMWTDGEVPAFEGPFVSYVAPQQD